MEGNRFDRLARAVGRATSRRRALAILAGGTAALAVPALARGVGSAWAGERRPAGGGPAGTTAAAAAFECRDDNVVIAPCHRVQDYLAECGYVCPDGERLSSGFACTSFESDYDVLGPEETVDEDPFRGWVAKRTVTVKWYVVFLASNVLDIYPPNVCCEDSCYEAIQQWRLDVDEQHEKRHRNFAYGLLDDANSRWENRRFEATGGSREAAVLALQKKIAKAANAEDEAITDRWNHATEPPFGPGPPPCARCAPKVNACNYCSGNCQQMPCQPGESCCPWRSSVICYDPRAEYCCSAEAGGGFCPHDWTCCLPEEGGGCCQPGTTCEGSGCRPSADSAGRADADAPPGTLLPRHSRN